jgi:hypothetical protein
LLQIFEKIEFGLKTSINGELYVKEMEKHITFKLAQMAFSLEIA